MPDTLRFKSHFLPSKDSLFLKPVVEANTSLPKPNFATKFPSFLCFSLSRKTQIQKPIVCVKRTERRSEFQRSTKIMIQLASILASNLKILPQPLNLVIEEFNGGEGGGLEFLKGFGRGGFGWWTRRRRRRRKGNLGVMVSLLIFVSLFLLFGRELRSDVCCGVLSFGLFGIILVKGFKRNVKNWIFGLCCFGAVIGLAARRKEAMKWIDEFRVCAPMVEIVRRGKSRGRRRSL